MQKRKMQKIQEGARPRKKDSREKEEKIKGQASSEAVNARAVEELIRSGQKPLRLDQILRMAHIPRHKKRQLEAVLHDLAQEGRLLRMHGGQWVSNGQVRTYVGRYSVQRSGVGFVDMARPEHAENNSEKDTGKSRVKKSSSTLSIFVHPSQAGEAWHGDMVRVALLPGRGGKRKEGAHGPSPEGRIVEVLERTVKDIMVRVEDRAPERRPTFSGSKRPSRRVKQKKEYDISQAPYIYCTPCDVRFSFALRIATENLDEDFFAHFEPQSLLLVRPTQQISAQLWQGEVLSTHGREDDVAVQEELVKINHQCPSDFPPAALEEAAQLPDVPKKSDYAHRVDLRSLPFVTIDGEEARDFDDAIYVQPTDKGGWSLQVAIADVTHYVHQHSALDKEAKIRGNSWYFPRSVEPMFPKSLSNGLCSLNPHQDRLVMVAHMHFDAHGIRYKSEFYAAVIYSHARLTYTQVKELVVDNNAQSQEAFMMQTHGNTVFNMLQHAEALARSLEKMRVQRGALDFHRPEPYYHFDAQGRIVDITRKEEHFAHKLIEECMIAANEAVAEFLEEKGMPLLYRVHPEPEPARLEGLFKTLASTSLAENVPRNAKASDLQGILHAAAGSEQEFLVGRVTLRTMPQARYQQENSGHFGLASTCYCHFTSPIRRYADMVVHRALKQVLRKQSSVKEEGADVSPLPEDYKLLALGDALNVTERSSMEAEREMARRLAVLIMQGHEGQEYEGIIAGVSDFGIFVELDAMPVEGMVRIRDLGDDFFEFDTEKQELLGVMSGMRYALGHKVQVRLVEVNLGRLEITFTLSKTSSMRLPRKQAAKLRKGRDKKFAGKRRKR